MTKPAFIILGIFQIVSGLVMLAIWSKFVNDSVSPFYTEPSTNAALAGHLLICFIIIASGILALLTSSKKMEVLYVISAAVSATVSAAMLWNNATTLGSCLSSFHYYNFFDFYRCRNALAYELTATSLAFSTISLIASLVGTITTALSACK